MSVVSGISGGEGEEEEEDLASAIGGIMIGGAGGGADAPRKTTKQKLAELYGRAHPLLDTISQLEADESGNVTIKASLMVEIHDLVEAVTDTLTADGIVI